MTQPYPVVRAAALDATGVIVADISCRSCGYNLRGLEAAGRCPECGADVEGSLADNLFRFADPGWTRKIAGGIALVVGSLVLSFAISIASVLLVYVGQISEPCLIISTMALTQVAGVIGTWLLTTPNPSGVGVRGTATIRVVLRATILIGLVMFVVSSYPTGLLLRSIIAYMVLSLSASVLHLVSEWCRYHYYEHLAGWIPDRAMVKQFSRLRWGYCGAVVLQVVYQCIVFVSWTAWGPRPSEPALWLQLVAIAGLVLFAFLTILQLLGLRRRALQDGRHSAALWNQISLPEQPFDKALEQRPGP